jgi:hypothetical protein
MEIRAVGAELLRADRQTDGRTVAYSNFAIALHLLNRVHTFSKSRHVIHVMHVMHVACSTAMSELQCEVRN